MKNAKSLLCLSVLLLSVSPFAHATSTGYEMTPPDQDDEETNTMEDHDGRLPNHPNSYDRLYGTGSGASVYPTIPETLGRSDGGAMGDQNPSAGGGAFDSGRPVQENRQ